MFTIKRVNLLCLCLVLYGGPFIEDLVGRHFPLRQLYYFGCCSGVSQIKHRRLSQQHTGRFWLNLYQGPRNIFFAKIWHYMVLMALQDTKKSMRYWKRPTKVEKVILKARESKNGKMVIFFAFVIIWWQKLRGSSILMFQGQKGQKGRTNS